jgi:hypothetical protein
VRILAKLTNIQLHIYQLSNNELHSNRTINVEKKRKKEKLNYADKEVQLALPRHERCSRLPDFNENLLR